MANIKKILRDNHIRLYDYAEFTEKMHIAEGRFGSVDRVNWRGRGKLVVLKTVRDLDRYPEEEVRNFVKALKRGTGYHSYNYYVQEVFGLTQGLLHR